MPQLRSAISTGSASLLDVVKALGEYLTAEEDELRNKGKHLVGRHYTSSHIGS